MRRAKQTAAAEGRTLTSLIEEGLRARLSRPSGPTRRRAAIPTFGGDGPADGVDLADLGQIKEILTTDEDAAYHPTPAPT
ncbi:MAG: hypothetical protein M3520_03610 [Actinomycetota bacterium]|nr:hypothetical protein [Actinomycetota bacterium]